MTDVKQLQAAREERIKRIERLDCYQDGREFTIKILEQTLRNDEDSYALIASALKEMHERKLVTSRLVKRHGNNHLRYRRSIPGLLSKKWRTESNRFTGLKPYWRLGAVI